ncbi:magnesium chelatase [Aquipuribacter nitratireducens]|uniref:Magnesium chelatase n=1 Tax=Aquipuribacter nitratireducens TaxID=650104 RepID=A0ABW0GIH2_9MICO
MTAPSLLPPAPPPGSPRTVGELRESGWTSRGVRDEVRANLLRLMRSGASAGDRWPGIVGFDDTVLPELERALLAGHDVVMLGERGQGKTRLLRSLAGLLDEWSPHVAGSPLWEDPFQPVLPATRALAEQLGDELPVGWRHRSERYGEKLATPDTSIGDLIGDVDPVRVAEGRSLGDPDTIHFGLLPRTNRGVFAVNELPDLAERIQVGLLNVLEERDLQVRGYALRLPLDVLLVASANPEDYTNRGRIITPLKDRFGAEVRTHYPVDVQAEVDLVTQEAAVGHADVARVPVHLVEVVARWTRLVRDSPSVDSRSGVSARFAVAAVETVAAAADRRAAVLGEDGAVVARAGDLEAAVATLRGKVEFEAGEEGREVEVLAHLLKVATAETFRDRLAGADLGGVLDRVADGEPVEVGDDVRVDDLLARLGAVPGLGALCSRLGVEDAPQPAELASVVEFVLEGLHLTRRLAKDPVGEGRARFSARQRPRAVGEDG